MINVAEEKQKPIIVHGLPPFSGSALHEITGESPQNLDFGDSTDPGLPNHNGFTASYQSLSLLVEGTAEEMSVETTETSPDKKSLLKAVLSLSFPELRRFFRRRFGQ